jgi:hypothetical protein
MIDTDGDMVGENLNPRATGRLRIIGRDGVARVVAETCERCGELRNVAAPPCCPADGVEVEVVGETDGARAFWQAFAAIATEVLDDEDRASEDRVFQENAA